MTLNRLMKISTFTLLTLALAGLVACGPYAEQTVEPSPYDEMPYAITEYMASPSVLIFSKTRSWRHEEGIAGGNLHFLRLAQSKGYGVHSSENGAVFNPEQLARFDVVIFNSFTGDSLSPVQKQHFQDWVEAGGAVMLIHGSGDASHADWPWYAETLIGPTFIGHPAAPQFQVARVETLRPHPIMEGVSESWDHEEEWYSFDSLPAAEFVPLLGVDETTYSPLNTQYGDISDLRMGEDVANHPVMWVRCVGQGRSFYSALGHKDTAFDAPNHALILSNAFDWVTGKTDPEGSGCSR